MPDLPLLMLTASFGGEFFGLPEFRARRSLRKDKYLGWVVMLGWLYFEVEITCLYPEVWKEADRV